MSTCSFCLGQQHHNVKTSFRQITIHLLTTDSGVLTAKKKKKKKADHVA